MGRSAAHPTYFYPRPPRGGRRRLLGDLKILIQFLSTPSARRATSKDDSTELAEDISIHALREEGDLSLSGSASTDARFLSTPSARRATDLLRGLCGGAVISIHALREEGDPRLLPVLPCPIISIHALREEGDERRPLYGSSSIDFYPRPPRGGRHWDCCVPKILNQFLSTPSARRATAMA